VERLDELQISCPERVAPELLGRLRQAVGGCPDVAFAHLPQAFVPGYQAGPELVLFVWFQEPALRSLRSALNLVSEAVARALTLHEYLDVVVLNSAPELLLEVERAGCLLVERDSTERQRALQAAAHAQESPGVPGSRSWWPF
jgi:hypothetical protein